MEKPDDMTSFIQQLEAEIKLQEELLAKFEAWREESLKLLNAPRSWED